MARRRLAVALLVPRPLATQIDGLRRACGDPRRGRIAPHITLVPPVNVAEDVVADVLSWCRDVAATTPILELTLGAPSTFAPATPLAWLSVGGDLDALAALHRALNAGPLTRPPEHAFVPHVTVSDKVDADRLAAILVALADFEAACTIDRLHVLVNQQLADGRWGWVPMADGAFERRRRIGVGGLPLDLSVGSALEPDAEALLHDRLEDGAGPVVVTARRDGEVVGVAVGVLGQRAAVLTGLVVGEGHRREGVGSHLLAQFVAEAAGRRCERAVHVAPSDSAVLALCRQRGWTDAGAAAGITTVVRLLA